MQYDSNPFHVKMEGKKIRISIIFLLSLIYTCACEDCIYTSYGYLHYNGTQNRSVYGNICLRWDSLPEDSFFYQDSMFPDDGSMSDANNYCRDPFDSGQEIFCYTMNPGLSRELCTAPYCDDPSGEHAVTVEGEMMRCRYLPEGGRCDYDEVYYCKDTHQIIRSKKKRQNCLELFCCSPKGCWHGQSHEYNWTWRHTEDGTVCRAWNSYLGREDPDPFNLPEQSLDDALNYCRDPDLSGQAWCYTNKRGFRGSFSRYPCNISSCDEYLTRHRYNHDCYEFTDKDLDMDGPVSESDDKSFCEAVQSRIYLEETVDDYPGCEGCSCCQMKGCKSGGASNYTGTWSRTIGGRKCTSWSETKFKNEDWRFADDTVADAFSYCRHTSDYREGQLWCFTGDKYLSEEECDIPDCDGLSSSTLEPAPATTITAAGPSSTSQNAESTRGYLQNTSTQKTVEHTSSTSNIPQNSGTMTEAAILFVALVPLVIYVSL